jgi:hypothetical protein
MVNVGYDLRGGDIFVDTIASNAHLVSVQLAMISALRIT